MGTHGQFVESAIRPAPEGCPSRPESARTAQADSNGDIGPVIARRLPAVVAATTLPWRSTASPSISRGETPHATHQRLPCRNTQ